MQLGDPLGHGDQQGLAAAQIIRRRAGGQAGPLVDGAVRHAVHPGLDEQGDGGVDDLGPAAVIGWRHPSSL
jgi:hypothetical protein